MIYKKLRKLSPEKAAYIAGIVDGEGTITLTRRNKYRNRCVSLTVSNNDLGILEFIKENTGIGRITSKVNYKNNHFPSFTYQVSNAQAFDLIEVITPYLRGIKKLRAQLILKNYHQLTPRNGKYTPALLKKRDRFIQQFFALKTATSRKFSNFDGNSSL